MRIAVMGAGGVGGYYGGMLARAGEDVTLIARGPHLRAIQTSGLTVKTAHVGEFTVDVRATDDPSTVGPVDLVLFCVKTYDTDVAAHAMRPLVGHDTTVLPLQNGVESVDRIGRIVGHEHVLGGTTYVSSKLESPGVIKEIWDHKVCIGEWNQQRSARILAVFDAFSRAQVAVEIAEDIRSAMWGKLLGVSAYTATCCVTRLSAAGILACEETTSLLWEALREGVAVASAVGVALPPDFVERTQRIVAGMDSTVRPSMFYDMQAGKPLELDDMIGVIVRLGRKHGVPTPLTFAMYAALKPHAGVTAPSLAHGSF